MVVLVALVATYNVCFSKNDIQMSNLALNNVEALAWGWGENNGWVADPCVPCMPKSCAYTKYIGTVAYWVNEPYVEFAD